MEFNYKFDVKEAIESNKEHLKEEVMDTIKLLKKAGVKKPTKLDAYREILDTVARLRSKEELQENRDIQVTLYEKQVIYNYLLDNKITTIN